MQVVEHRLLTDHRYAIVDGSQREQIPASAQTQVIAPAFLKEDTARCPVLVDLRSLSAADHDAWLEQALVQWRTGGPLWFSTLVATEAEATYLHAHLRSRVSLTMPDLAQPVQFRFYDPHTLTHLPRLLGMAGLAWLMGPMTGLTYALPFTLVRAFSHLSRPDVTPPAFRIGETHRAALQALSVVNRALVKLPSLKDEIEWRMQSTTAEGLVRRAQAHRITSVEDQVAFVLHGLQVHPRFDDHPRLKALLAQLKQATPEDELDYRELTAVLSDENWQRIAHDMNHPATPLLAV